LNSYLMTKNYYENYLQKRWCDPEGPRACGELSRAGQEGSREYWRRTYYDNK
jgi:hypothetical protein